MRAILLALRLLQQCQHLARAADDLGGKSGELGDLDAVGAVGGPGLHLVQEHDLVVPLAHVHGDVGDAVQAPGERGQLVVVGGKQHARPRDIVQELDRRPGDRQAVEGRGAAADLVEDDERALARLIEDGRRLHHLDHERRAPARQIVGGADAAEQAIDRADGRRARRHVGAHLRQHGDQRVLAQEGRLAGHVGARHQPDAALGRLVEAGRRRDLGAAQHAIVLDEGAGPRRFQRLLHHGMAPAADLEGLARRRRGAACSLRCGQARQARRSRRARQGRRRPRLGPARPPAPPPPAR